MVHSLEKNTDLTYVYRLYPYPGTLRYVFAMPITYRGGGEWEAHAWNSVYKLWPEGPRETYLTLMLWIHEELKRTEPRFRKLTGTFEIPRYAAYERIFRRWFDFVKLRRIQKVYNDCDFDAWVVEMRPKI